LLIKKKVWLLQISRNIDVVLVFKGINELALCARLKNGPECEAKTRKQAIRFNKKQFISLKQFTTKPIKKKI